MQTHLEKKQNKTVSIYFMKPELFGYQNQTKHYMTDKNKRMFRSLFLMNVDAKIHLKRQAI